MNNLSPGEILFYGGIAGMLIVAIIAVVVVAVLSGSRSRLRRQLNREYFGVDEDKIKR